MARTQLIYVEIWKEQCQDCGVAHEIAIERERGGPIVSVGVECNPQIVSNSNNKKKEDTINGGRIRGKHSA